MGNTACVLGFERIFRHSNAVIFSRRDLAKLYHLVTGD